MLSILQRLPLLPLNSSGILYPRNKKSGTLSSECGESVPDFYGDPGIRQPDKLNGKLQFKNLRRYIMLTNHKYLLILIIHILLCHKERIVAGKLIILCREVTGSRICNTAVRSDVPVHSRYAPEIPTVHLCCSGRSAACRPIQSE